MYLYMFEDIGTVFSEGSAFCSRAGRLCAARASKVAPLDYEAYTPNSRAARRVGATVNSHRCWKVLGNDSPNHRDSSSGTKVRLCRWILEILGFYGLICLTYSPRTLSVTFKADSRIV